MIFSAFMLFIGFLLIGPSKLIYLPDSIILMAIGQAVAGIFCATVLIPSLPEMVEYVTKKYPAEF